MSVRLEQRRAGAGGPEGRVRVCKERWPEPNPQAWKTKASVAVRKQDQADAVGSGNTESMCLMEVLRKEADGSGRGSGSVPAMVAEG